MQQLPQPHAAPVFGAAKTVTYGVAALQAIGYLLPDEDEFDLVKNSLIIKNKARSLCAKENP